MPIKLNTSQRERLLHLKAIADTGKENRITNFMISLIEDANNMENLINSVLNAVDGHAVKSRDSSGCDLKTLFGTGLRKKLAEQKLTMSDLRKKSGVSEKTISRICDERSLVSFKTAETISESLGCTALDILLMGEMGVEDV